MIRSFALPFVPYQFPGPFRSISQRCGIMVRFRPPIVLFGDSITQFAHGESPLGTPVTVGWASLLGSAYQRRADVLERGFSGYNTRHALGVLPRIFPGGGGSARPLFCTVFFGANDAVLPSSTSDSGRQHVPLDEYAENLRAILAAIREATGAAGGEEDAPVVPIVVVTPPPVDAERWREVLGAYDHCDRSNLAARRYGAEAKKVASSMEDCPVVDAWELLGGDDPGVYRQHLCDGLHLSDSGNRLVYEGILEILRTGYPHLCPAEDGEAVGIRAEEAPWSDLC